MSHQVVLGLGCGLAGLAPSVLAGGDWLGSYSLAWLPRGSAFSLVSTALP